MSWVQISYLFVERIGGTTRIIFVLCQVSMHAWRCAWAHAAAHWCHWPSKHHRTGLEVLRWVACQRREQCTKTLLTFGAACARQRNVQPLRTTCDTTRPPPPSPTIPCPWDLLWGCDAGTVLDSHGPRSGSIQLNRDVKWLIWCNRVLFNQVPARFFFFTCICWFEIIKDGSYRFCVDFSTA